jgi:transcriptional repressor NrdR
MRCPTCSSKETRVIDSRLSPDGAVTRRRRECEKCSFRFSTIEEMEILDLTMIKRDGSRESYSRDKLIKGLRKALEKRPVGRDDFEKLVRQIERDIQKKKKKNEIKSGEVGEIIMNRLKSFDKVAYIRFASVYRAFEDVKTFEREISKLKKRR